MKIKFLFLLVSITSIINITFATIGARYIIICPDSYIQSLQPLADWKTKKGVKTIIAPLSVTGSSAAQIKNYILNGYNNWDIRPEYILIAGLGTLVPYSGSSDDYYADITGNYRIELSIGRLPFTTIDQCNLHVAKILAYERTPYIDDTLWFKKGTIIVREDGSSPPDDVFWENARYIANFWQNFGYTQVDTFSRLRGHTSTNVINSINDGRMFVVYRGEAVTNWWTPFAITPSNLANDNKTPVVVSGTCQTMSVSSDGYLGNAFLNAGSATALKGGVAYFGTTVVASGSNLGLNRGIVTKGFFQSIFGERTFTLGDAAKRGKFIIDSIQPPSYTTTRYSEWELFGDPELQLWTSAPKRMVAIYDSVIPVTQTDLIANIQSDAGLPIQDALVCIKMDTTVYSYGYTNPQGQIRLPMQTNVTGVMSVTVTAHNFRPFEGTTRIIPANTPYLVYDSCYINDSLGGNNDHKINPGENIQLRIFLQNSGGAPASGVQAVLRSSDQLVTITDSIQSFGTISQGTIAGSQGLYRFLVNPNCYNNYQLHFQLFVQDNQGHDWTQQITIPVFAAKLIFVSAAINDSFPGGNGNGRLGSMENAKVIIQINNTGENLYQATAALNCQSQYITITDSLASFGDISAGGTGNNIYDPFAISTSPNLPKNYQLNFTVTLSGQGGTYTYHDSLVFGVVTETGNSTDPSGPDAYGYWAYDNTDTLSGRAPSYNWFEIGPSGFGSLIDSITNRDAAVVTLPLPFTFRYYGQNYDSISVCCNGFLAMGRTSYRLGTNSGIPDTAGPAAMISPFWCDLNANENTNPAGAGDIYQYYDSSNHRWIVEFYGIAHYGQTNIRETFQTIILDPVYYPTQTGDGEIIFMYNTVADPAVATVGIENQTQTRGIQYVYNNNYNPTAAVLANGRAIKFSTQTPTNFQSPWIVLTRATYSDSIGGNNNGIPEPGETIRLITYLRNSGSIQAQNVLVTLRSLDGNVIVTDSIRDFGNIAQGGEVNNQTNPYLFNIIANPTDTILDFVLQVQAQNYSSIQYFSIGMQRHPGIEDNFEANIKNFVLKQNRPNPFKYYTTIEYSLPISQHVELKVYNSLGRVVKTLVAKDQSSGIYQVIWDKKDEMQHNVSAGIYYCVFSCSQNYKITKKMVLD